MGHNGASFTEGPKILSWIKTEARRITESAHGLPVVGGTVGLTSVLDNIEPVLAPEFQNRIHIRRLPKQMNRDNRFGFGGQRMLQRVRIHRVGSFIYVDEYRTRSTMSDSLGSGHERARNRDHLVSKTNTAG